jgi:aminopeptidase YwaD
MDSAIATILQRHLQALAGAIGARQTGSEANRQAEDYIAGAMTAAGCSVERQGFACLDWEPLGVELRLGGEALPAAINPFSPSCQVVAPLVGAGNLAELAAADLAGNIAVLYGELSAEPLFPKHFPFFAVDEHVRIIAALERGQPAAVIAVSPYEEHPAPVIEDGDFALPSVTVPAAVGRRLLARLEAEAGLSIRSVVRPATGANVVGRKAGASERRTVICAHFDTKPETLGALDNAAGVATMLALAGSLPAQALSLEFIAFNGEDYYAAPGQVAYLRAAGESLAEIDLVINIDGAGLEGAGNTIALFDPPPDLAAMIRGVMARHPRIAEAAPWPQGDHSIFWQRGVPAVAITTAAAWELVGGIIHTANDTVERVSAGSLAEVVAFVADILATRGQT